MSSVQRGQVSRTDRQLLDKNYAKHIPTVSPLLTSVASRNLLLYPSLATHIPSRQAKVRRRKDVIGMGTTARSIPERLIVRPGGRRRAGGALALTAWARVIKWGACMEARGKRGQGAGGWTSTRCAPGKADITHGLIPDRRVVLEQGAPPGAAVDAGLARQGALGSACSCWRATARPAWTTAVAKSRVTYGASESARFSPCYGIRKCMPQRK